MVPANVPRGIVTVHLKNGHRGGGDEGCDSRVHLEHYGGGHSWLTIPSGTF